MTEIYVQHEMLDIDTLMVSMSVDFISFLGCIREAIPMIRIFNTVLCIQEKIDLKLLLSARKTSLTIFI